MSNHNGRTTQSKKALDLGARAAQVAEATSALTTAATVDVDAVSRRLPSGHVLLPSFPDGDLVCFDPSMVCHIERLKPSGVVDLSQLDATPEVCQVNYQYGLHMVIGTVEQVAGILFGSIPVDAA